MDSDGLGTRRRRRGRRLAPERELAPEPTPARLPHGLGRRVLVLRWIWIVLVDRLRIMLEVAARRPLRRAHAPLVVPQVVLEVEEAAFAFVRFWSFIAEDDARQIVFADAAIVCRGVRAERAARVRFSDKLRWKKSESE